MSIHLQLVLFLWGTLTNRGCKLRENRVSLVSQSPPVPQFPHPQSLVRAGSQSIFVEGRKEQPSERGPLWQSHTPAPSALPNPEGSMPGICEVGDSDLWIFFCFPFSIPPRLSSLLYLGGSLGVQVSNLFSSGDPLHSLIHTNV